MTSGYRLRGGSVGVACAGDQVSLVYASPFDGFTQHIDRRGPAEVRVRFVGDDATSNFSAKCVKGKPTVVVNEDEDDDDDDDDEGES